jgi:nucleoid-associated protein YgaU
MRVIITATLMAAGLWFPIVAEQPDMTCEEYGVALQSAQQREQIARGECAKQVIQIDSLKSQIAQIEQRIAVVIENIYSVLGITEHDVANVEFALSEMQNSLNTIRLFSSDELGVHKQEIREIEARFSVLQAKRVCLLHRVAVKVSGVESALASVKAQLLQATAPAPSPSDVSTKYTVLKSGSARNLSKIAESVYGDQYEWPRIYRANKLFIDKWYLIYKNRSGDLNIMRPQDFLLPGWTLEIPR